KDEGDVTGQSCAECHGKAPTATNPTPILTAYHGKCKGCHERMEVHGKKSGPVMCGSCHTK
ncbi:MAG TPA: acidic cytochrome c TcmA, partial [Syntrophobacteraceae bacterium]|nr:acidic cytochrome c TcmA [Syntrophobacteraceae bacterium]